MKGSLVVTISQNTNPDHWRRPIDKSCVCLLHWLVVPDGRRSPRGAWPVRGGPWTSSCSRGRLADWNDQRLRDSRTIKFRVAGPGGRRASAVEQPKSRRDVLRCSRASHSAVGSNTEPCGATSKERCENPVKPRLDQPANDTKRKTFPSKISRKRSRSFNVKRTHRFLPGEP